MPDITRIPIDVEAIARRAESAPAGAWAAFPDGIWIPWTADGDDEPGCYTWTYGRWITVQGQGWHTGSPDPGPELWDFLTAARDDVLQLAAEIRRLRARQQHAARGGTHRSPGLARRPRRRRENAPAGFVRAASGIRRDAS
jgi:hypothetical protein